MKKTNKNSLPLSGICLILLTVLFAFSQAHAQAQTEPPTVTTPTSANVAATTATLGGNVTSAGGGAITERGVVYALTGTNSDPLIGGTGVVKATKTGTTGVFTVAVTGLTQTTGYSFKAYAINSLGTSYSSVATFTTTPPDPTGAAGLVVTTNSDVRANDGVISLRDAVAYANSGNAGATPEITFSVTGIIETSSPAISITKNLTITGPGAGSLTISGNGNTGVSHQAASIFRITAGIVGISGLTLKDGTGFSVPRQEYNPNNNTYYTTFDTFGGCIYMTGGTVTIADTTISNSTARYGGGISVNGGSLELKGSTVSNNRLGPYAQAGGLYLQSGTMAISNSTISGNTAGYGAGIISNGTMTISNSTISGNIAENYVELLGYQVRTPDAFGRVPGVIYYGYFSFNGVAGGILNNGTMTLTNSTISGNVAKGYGTTNINGGGGVNNRGTLTVANSTISGNKGQFGGGVHTYSYTLNLSNSIVAGNISDTIIKDGLTYGGGPDIFGTVATGDYNLVQDTAGATLSGTHNITGQAANLGALANNGGPTQTHSLLAGSPAIDAGDPNFDTAATPFDQRGYARKDGSAIDIGAFEVQAQGSTTATAINSQPQNQTVCESASASFTVGATSESLTYQWRKDGVNLIDGGSISGATTENLTINSAATSDAGTYDVVVSGSDGTATSAAATLALNSAPIITNRPADQSVNPGADASFTADADGAQSVQWQVSTDGGTSFSDISGATAGTLTLSAVASTQNGSQYRAVFSGCGNPATSDAATLTVNKLAQTITFDTIADKTYGDAPFALSASSTSNLPVSFSIVSGPATLSGNTLTITGAGTITARAEQSGDTDYNAASSVERSFSVAKAQATITLSDLSQTYSGTAKAATATTNPSGLSVSLTYDGSSTAPTNSGSYAVVATISDENHQGGATGTLVINQKTTSISLLPQILSYGNSIAEGASVSGGPGSESIVYTLASGNNATSGFAAYSNPVNAGGYTLKAVYAGNTNYAGSTAAANVTINKVNQVIAWSDPAAISYGTTLGAAQLNASLTTGDGTLTYNPAAGTTLNAGDGQALRVDASETANYGAAFKIVHINVAKANQTITFGAIADKTYGDAPFALTASSSSNLPVSFSVVSGPATISGSTLTITGAGAVTVSAAQTGSDQYNAAPSVERSFNVGKAQATITLSSLSQTYNGTAKAATANTTPEGLNVTLAYSQNGATIVSPTNAGSYTVEASVNDANYQGTATDTLTIAKATPVITWSNPADIAYGTNLGAAQLNATASTAGSFVYNPAANTLLNAGANQNLSATFTPNDANNYATADKSVTINVLKANQTITFANPGTKAFGSAPFNLGGSASSGLAVSYTVISGPATVSGSTLTITGTGSVTVRASQSGNGNYNAAQDVTQTFTVNKAALLVTAENKSGTYSDALPNFTYTITGFINGDTASVVTGAPALGTTVNVVGGNIMSGAGTYAITPSLGNLSAANYSFSFAPGALTVGKETTQTDYTGDSYVITAGPTIGTASAIRLAAHLTQEADGALGDITLAKARIELFKFSNTGTTANYVFGNLAVNSAGDVETTASIAVDDAYTVRVTVESANGFWTANPVYEGTLTVAYGSTEKRVTGGGWVADSGSANQKGNFGFTVNYQRSGAPKGNSLYTFRGTDGYNYRVKSNSWQGGGLTFYGEPWKAAFSGNCNVQKIDPLTGATVESWGNYTFTIDLVDGDLKNPRETDRYTIQVLTNTGAIWRQIGTRTSPVALGGGNVAVKSN